MEIVDAGFCVVVVTAVAEGIEFADMHLIIDLIAVRVGYRENQSPGVVGVFRRDVAVVVINYLDVAAGVADRVVVMLIAYCINNVPNIAEVARVVIGVIQAHSVGLLVVGNLPVLEHKPASGIIILYFLSVFKGF